MDRLVLRTKRLIDKYVLQKILSDRLVVPYLFFWARIVLWIRRPFIIAVTGSVGKTMTKDVIAATLMHHDAKPHVGLAGKTPKNLNDDVGLPLTVLRYGDWLDGHPKKKLAALCALPFRALGLAISSHYPDILVLEYGTHWEGHLHRLARLARPRIAVVTTIGPAHLERLKTLEGVVQEKSAVVRAVPPTGLVILGHEHRYVSRMEREARAPVIRVPGRGLELSRNIARAIGTHLRIPEDVVSAALRDVKPPLGRLTRLEFPGLTVIDDTYNANPLSMKLGLDTLAETARPGSRRMGILGVMAELGDEAPRYHDEIGAYSRHLTDVVIAVGELARRYNPDHWFESSEACAAHIGGLLRPGDCVLVKGSASARMGVIVRKLREIGERLRTA